MAPSLGSQHEDLHLPAEPSNKHQQSQVLMRRRTYNGSKWSSWTNEYERPSLPKRFDFNFAHGGQLSIYPNLLTDIEQNAVTEELLQCSYFRQYTIQNNPEPRTHFLLHEDATDDFDGEAQPGYRYGSIRMKARPLHHLPQVEQLSGGVATMLGEAPKPRLRGSSCFWNVGVNPVLYRDGRDRIGFHADDDQNEELILTALVSSPAGTTRRISIHQKNDKSRGNHVGDEQFELFLDAGDAYSMDGEMQQHYVHSVPCDKNSVHGGNVEQDGQQQQQKRIAVVFRRGLQLEQKADSGKPSASLQPRVLVPYIFGRMKSIKEGSTYSRIEINDLHAHRSQQKGVSGGRDSGCDAIIVSGLRPDGLGYDHMLRLMYAAGTREGAFAILKSSIEALPIRVFRSSVLKSPYRALSKKPSPACYRYDGLYKVEAIQFKDATSHHTFVVDHPAEHIRTRVPASRVYLFYLARVDAGDGEFANALSSDDFLRHSIERQTMLPVAAEESPLHRQTVEDATCLSFFSLLSGIELSSTISTSMLSEIDYDCANALSFLRESLRSSERHSILMDQNTLHNKDADDNIIDLSDCREKEEQLLPRLGMDYLEAIERTRPAVAAAAVSDLKKRNRWTLLDFRSRKENNREVCNTHSKRSGATKEARQVRRSSRLQLPPSENHKRFPDEPLHRQTRVNATLAEKRAALTKTKQTHQYRRSPRLQSPLKQTPAPQQKKALKGVKTKTKKLLVAPKRSAIITEPTVAPLKKVKIKTKKLLVAPKRTAVIKVLVVVQARQFRRSPRLECLLPATADPFPKTEQATMTGKREPESLRPVQSKRCAKSLQPPDPGCRTLRKRKALKYY